ncbi:MAG TPA: nucleotidyl transferase AbiEii/AbiGii toxin family protein [Thermoanaerobaculia bacterium]|nr:nucleotidyl transferase AbiEii/AbiGii toxin family protein [Thermoanaerobaculia bacterium]
MPNPTRPTQLSAHAEAALQALADAGLGHQVSLGGALGLQHYCEYRFTHDVDAWWEPAATAEDRENVLRAVEEALHRFGSTRLRRWGEVSSLDLLVEGKVVFSFQVAIRSAQIEPTTTLPWVDVALDSLPDLVASKMVALVERGAPRDFLDIHTLCQKRLVTPRECWRLWKERQERAGSDADPHRAKLAVETHLSRIAQHRPLAGIAEPEERATAANLRHWFAQEFLDALLD